MSTPQELLQKLPSFYDHEHVQSSSLDLYNTPTIQSDIHVHTIWCQYIHHYQQQIRHRKPNFHSHSFFELHFVLDGTMLYHESSGISKQLSAGNFVLIAPKNQHFLTRQSQDAKTVAIAFELIFNNPERGKKIQELFSSLTSSAKEIPTPAYQLIELIIDNFINKTPFFSQNIKHLTNILILDIIHSVFDNEILPPPIKINNSRLNLLEKYISDNHTRIITVPELAEYLNISTRQLNNIVTAELGFSTKTLIDKRKSEFAQKLLLETDFSLQEISDQLGFSDHYNFIRFFKRLEGLSPGAFRKSKGYFLKS